LGAPANNTNAARHGLKMGLTNSMLPKGCSYVRRRLGQFRRVIEQEVLDVHGSINVVQALAIDTAARWCRHAMLAERWLRLRAKEMSDADRLKYSREIAMAAAARDRAVEQLEIDRQPQDLLTAVIQQPMPPQRALEPPADESDSEPPRPQKSRETANQSPWRAGNE